MHIQPINDVNLKGKFIINENLSVKEQEVVNKFLNNKYGRSTLREFIEKTPYDIVMKRSEQQSNYLQMWTHFKTLFDEKEKGFFISALNVNSENLNNDIKNFRGGIEWFKLYKKDNYGYNSEFEKFRTNMRFYFFG